MYRFAIPLLILVVPLVAWSQSTLRPDKLSPDITSFEVGVICAPEAVGTSPAPGTLAGSTHIIDVDPPFVSTARRVPAVIGIGFGVKAMVGPAQGIEDVIMVVSHPPMGKDKVEVQSYTTRIGGIAPSLTFYQFDYSYEMLPGIWNMTAMQGDNVIYSASFEVLPPQQVPELASVCGFENLLS